MGHFIRGVVGRTHAISGLEAAFRERALALTTDWSLLPVDEENTPPDLTKTDPVLNFECLTLGLLEFLRKASVGTEFAYIETEYFGGAGGQGSVVLSNGEVKQPPRFDDYPMIDDALRLIGVAPTPGTDAFDTLGLGNFRSNDALRQAAGPKA